MRTIVITIAMLVSSLASAQSVRVTATTVTKPGQFAPRNCVAVWIEDANGTFVKTIQRWAGVRAPDLVAWRQKAGTADVDAVSGATRLDHSAPLVINWDLKNKNGAIVPDGTYTIRMEMTEDNTTMASANHQGTFTFVKGPNSQQQSTLSNNGFTNVSIDYTAPPNPAACNNGVIDPGETCDGASCPTSCPPSEDMCMDNVLTGSAATCNAQCVLQPIADCMPSTNDDVSGGCTTTPMPAATLTLFAFGLLALRRRRPNRV